MTCASAGSLQPHCCAQHRQAMSTNTHSVHNSAGPRSMFSSDAARRAPGSSPADLPRPVKQGSDGTRKATKAMGIGSLAMSPQNSGKLAGKHHCSLPTAWTAPVMLTTMMTWMFNIMICMHVGVMTFRVDFAAGICCCMRGLS